MFHTEEKFVSENNYKFGVIFVANSLFFYVIEIDITEECMEFIDNQNEKIELKFFQLIEVIGEIKVINSNFLKKLQSTQFSSCESKQEMNTEL